jgi:hypothetical protein
MTNNFNILVNKIKTFRIKYYSYKLVKGVLLTLFLLLVLYTIFSLVEYFIYLSTDIRRILFYGFITFGCLLTLQFIILPLFKLLHLLRPMDIKKSAEFIQRHFGEIKDKLLNIIELSNISDKKYSSEIVLASIDQKINELNIYDFREAVQFKNLRIIFLYFVFSLMVTFSIFLLNKAVFTSGANRIIHYNTQFTKPAPFSFKLLNDDLQAVKGDSYKIKVECVGDELPKILYINIGESNYLMKNTVEGRFEFEMASVINPVSFYFTDLKYKSDKHVVKLLPKPGITHFDISVSPPSYTGLSNQTYENKGDLKVPHGTKIEWDFKGIDIDTLYLSLEDSANIGATKHDNVFSVETTFYESATYHVFIKNDITESELALSYAIEVIPDLFPEINIVQVQDSIQMQRYFFKGVIGDDYGFTDLRFHYNVNNNDSAISIPFVKNLQDQDFYYSFNFTDLSASSGSVSYYFSVTDNDVVNGYKTTTSQNFVIDIPDKEKILANEKEQFKSLEDKLRRSQELGKEIQSDLQNLRMKNMDSNISEWEKSQMINDVLSKQNSLEKLHDEIRKDNEKLNNFLNSFQKSNEEIRKKQEQIADLLDEVFTDELKELLEEFNKLAEEFDSKKFNRLSNQMDLSYDDLQKQLDRNLELLRKMKVEQKLQGVIDEMKKMAIEEENLSQEIDDKRNYKEVKEKVADHKEALKTIEQEIGDALKMNEELEKPLNFDDFDDELEDIINSMGESQEQLEKMNRKKSGSKLKQNSDKLNSTASSMQEMLNSNTMEQNMENIDNLKQILDNLVFLSFQQEDILKELTNINSNDPSLAGLNQKQRKIKSQSQIVKDSLYTLAERTPQLGNTVNNELLSMQLHLDKAMEQMGEADFSNAKASQQYVITVTNNLALLLNEALENLEEQMANAQPGNQQCENSCQGKQGMKLLKKASENIKQQLQQMIDQMKNGGTQKMNQKLGQSLMEHEMMQQMLRDIMNNGNVGSQARKSLQEIDKMLEENRKQLMDKNVNARMISRQNQITSRLLEAEKAELKRGFEDKRESQSAEDFYSNPVKFFEYTEDRDFSIEYLDKNSHKLNIFYNNKYKQYLNIIENQ